MDPSFTTIITTIHHYHHYSPLSLLFTIQNTITLFRQSRSSHSPPWRHISDHNDDQVGLNQTMIDITVEPKLINVIKRLLRCEGVKYSTAIIDLQVVMVIWWCDIGIYIIHKEGHRPREHWAQRRCRIPREVSSIFSSHLDFIAFSTFKTSQVHSHLSAQRNSRMEEKFNKKLSYHCKILKIQIFNINKYSLFNTSTVQD